MYLFMNISFFILKDTYMYLSKYFTDEIVRRYFVDNSNRYAANMIVDERCIASIVSGRGMVSRDSYVISEWFSKKFGARQLPFKFMLQTLNISDNKLKSLVLTVKRKKLNFVFAGFGGTGMNTAYWLQKILDHTGDVYLFDTVHVYDDDEVEFSNLLRFPYDLSSCTENNKAYLYTNKNSLGRRHYKAADAIKFVDPSIQYTFANTESFAHPDYSRRLTFSEDTIVYGAPDLATRKEVALTNCRFIAATHGGNSCSMTVQPDIDENLQTEGYGVVHLNTFFWNQLAMTIGLLEFLAEDDIQQVETTDMNSDGTPVMNLDGTVSTVFADVSKWDQEGQIFKFSFEEFIESGSFGKASRVLDFNITKDDGGRG